MQSEQTTNPESEQYTPVLIWEDMLKGGVSPVHISDLVQKHISALKDLPDDIENKQLAIEKSQQFLDFVAKLPI